MGGFSDLHNASSGTCGKTLVSYERPGRILFKKGGDLHERERDIKAAGERSWTSGEIFWQITGQSAPYR